MLQLIVSEEDRLVANIERFCNHPPQMLKQLHILAFANEMDRQSLACVAGVCTKTVTEVKKRYARVGLEGILNPKRNRPKSALEPFRKKLRSSFKRKACPMMAEAVERCRKLTRCTLKTTAVRDFLRSDGLRFRHLDRSDLQHGQLDRRGWCLGPVGAVDLILTCAAGMGRCGGSDGAVIGPVFCRHHLSGAPRGTDEPGRGAAL